MNHDGEYLIKRIVKRLDENNIRAHDSNIIHRLRSMNKRELWDLLTFGDVVKWHNDRVNQVKVTIERSKS